MTIIEMLSALRSQGIHLWVDGEKLKYRAPHGALTAELKSQLIERKAELLTYLKSRNLPATASFSSIARARRSRELPLSFAEEGLWLLEQLSPGLTVWNMQLTLRISGALNVSLLEKSLNSLVQRQEILRTAFELRDQNLSRVIASELRIELPVLDLRGSSRPDEEIRRIADDEIKTPFELSKAPLFRPKLLRLSEIEHIFLLTKHHIITDAWSSRLFLKELFAFYDAFTVGLTPALADLPIQYSDFALWQRHRQTGALELHFAYWKGQLDGIHVVELPADKQKRADRSYRGSTERMQLPSSLSSALNALCKQERTTLFMILLAAFKVLLYRYTGETDIIVGSTIAGRNKSDLEPLIGMFINLLPLRSNLSGEPIFREALRRVREVCLEAYRHQDYPFEKLIQALSPARDLSQNSFFQVLFNVVNLPSIPGQVDGLTIEQMARFDDTARFDLTFFASEKPEGLEIIASYKRDLFTPDHISAVLEQYKYLLEQVVENPDRRIDDYSLVTSAAKRVLPDPTAPLDDRWYGAVHDGMADFARKQPDKLAVQDRDEAWTYKELNDRSNQLAHCLRENGVALGDTVAIYAHRNASLVWALFGVLKAGAAFCVIDPSHPADRVKEYLSATKPTAVIQIGAAGELNPQMEELLKDVSLRCRLTLPDLTRARQSQFLSQYPTENPTVKVGPDDLAYVIFTSGSTGKPKGVMGRHGPLTHFSPWVKETFDLSENDRFSLLAGLSSNILQREVFTALFLGATLDIPEVDAIGSPGGLDEWMRQKKVSVVHLTPAMAQLLESSARQPIPSVRRVFFTGDLLKIQDVGRVQKLMPQAEIVNFYNSSETQRGGSYTVVSAQQVENEKDIPSLGRGVTDVQLLVLNKHRELAGVGELGEICVRSPHMARGYLGDEELTKERFITNPFTGIEGDRVYRTGEQGRFLPNGDVEFVARGQDHVSVRGFRVAPGEIEACLRTHPSVADAVIVARADGQDRLVGFLQTEKGLLKSVDEIRAFLRTRLPDYMIPWAFVYLDSLPLAATGKIDQRALEVMAAEVPEVSSPFVAAQTEAEKFLSALWVEILGVERVGIHDNFFELGGHSLLGVKLLAGISQRFGINLPLRAIFEFPTIAQLALAMAEYQEKKTPEIFGTEKNKHQGSGPNATVIDEARLQQRDDQKTELTVSIAQRTSASLAAQPTIPRAPQAVPLPLSFAEEGLWILEQMRPGMTAWNSQVSVHLRGKLDASLLERSLNALIQRQEILRTTFGFNNGRPERAINSQINLTLPVVELGQSVEIEQAVRRIAADDRQLPFDLSQAPLFRLKLLRLSASEHILLLTKHHIITDAWSNRVFFQELVALYEAFATRHSQTLPDLPLQYSDYAYWVRHQPIREMEYHFSYWKRQLEGFHVVELPRDKQRHAERTFRGSTQRTQLSLSRSRDLRRRCKEETVSPFMVLLAAFKLLLYRYTGETDIVIGATVAGRNKPELEHLIGNFINLLPLRTDLSGQPTFREVLKRAREVCLEAYQHQDYPFEKLVQELSPTRELSQNPFFRVLFDVFNLPRMPYLVSGLTIERRPRSGGSAAHDLTLRFPESSEGIGLSIDYRIDFYSDAWIAELLEQYKYLLEQVVENPDRRIDDYSLVTSSAKRLLPDPTVPLDNSWYGPVHEVIAHFAQEQPDKPAVQDRDEIWTYKELNDRSNRLARYLLAQQIGPEDVVAIYAHRNVHLVWALIGVLKAGAAFCVIDPSHPPVRVQEYLSASDSKALIQIGAACEPNAEMATVLNYDSLRCRITLDGETLHTLSQYPTDDPAVAVGPNHLAYVIFTSGSTGRPKGVLGRHGPLTHFVPWLKVTFGLSENDRFSFLSGLATNKLQRELFTALTLGGTVCMPAPDDIGSFGRLDEWLRREAISVVHLTPAMAQLLEETATQPIPSVRRVFFGGDLLRLRDVNRVRRLMPIAEIANFYNSSETQRGGSCIIFSDSSIAGAKEVPPLGRGVKDVQLLVLNHGGQLAGVGELGEICVRSPHMARGYLGDEELTKERFITNPFTGIEGDRVYRTGEQGRYLPNGDVEFVARDQDQVSIRGFRVELGEIEAVLLKHPAVRETVLAAHERTPGNYTLVAYVIAARESSPTASDLRAFLKEQLPDYMIPAGFIFVESLPLTPTGKVDRQALPLPEAVRRELTSLFVAPRTALEKLLAASWIEILGVERVGAEDNFFELGGHSLAATQIIARICHAFDVELPLRRLYEAPTIAALAAALLQVSAEPLRIEKTAELLLKLAQLSEDQVDRMLAEKRAASETGNG